MFSIFIYAFGIFKLSVDGQSASCDFYQFLEIGQKYEIFSRGFKKETEAKRLFATSSIW